MSVTSTEAKAAGEPHTTPSAQGAASEDRDRAGVGSMLPPPKAAPQGQIPYRRFLLVFLALTAGGLGLIFYQAGGMGSVFSSLAGLRNAPFSLALLALCLCLEWFTDYLRYVALARCFGISMPLGFGLQVVFVHLFFSYLTPGGSFGAPITIYMLYKRGEKLPHAIALAAIKPFLLFFLMLLLGSVIFLVFDLSFSATTERVLFLSTSVILFLTCLVASVVFFPQAGLRVLGRLFSWLRLRAQRGRLDYPTPRLDRWERGSEATIQAFALFGKSGWKGILASLVTTALNLFFVVAISVVLLYALGFKGTHFDYWLFSFTYYFLIAFAPTPGGSGIAEGGGYLFFKDLAPAPVVGTYVLLWRFFTCYLVMIVGSLIFVRFLQRTGETQINPMEEVDHEVQEMERRVSQEKQTQEAERVLSFDNVGTPQKTQKIP